MTIDLTAFAICPNCGSTECLENYPVLGKSLCSECGHKTLKIPLKEEPKDDIYWQNCPFCGKDSEQVETLYVDDFVLVFKCKNCSKLEGYKIDPESKYDHDELDESYFSGKDVARAKREGKYILDTLTASKCAEIAKALRKKEKNPKGKCKKQLHSLLKEKTETLKAIGVTEQTIIRAFNKAQSYIEDKGILTEKQLILLICGSITYAEDVQLIRNEISNRYATERNLAEVFNVDRKTIRKWKKLLEKDDKPPKLGIWFYRENGSLESGVIEVPKDIQAVKKLEKPYKGMCCFCGRENNLIWRIKCTNDCWSDICQSDYEMFKTTYWEYKGALTLL